MKGGMKPGAIFVLVHFLTEIRASKDQAIQLRGVPCLAKDNYGHHPAPC